MSFNHLRKANLINHLGSLNEEDLEYMSQVELIIQALGVTELKVVGYSTDLTQLILEGKVTDKSGFIRVAYFLYPQRERRKGEGWIFL